jgi:hypothetical protein
LKDGEEGWETVGVALRGYLCILNIMGEVGNFFIKLE